MKAIITGWDISHDVIIEQMMCATYAELFQLIDLHVGNLWTMTMEEFEDYCVEYFENNNEAKFKFFELPEEIDIPDGMTDEDEISDYITDTVGFFNEGFILK